MKSLSRVRLLATSWTAAHQAPQSMGFSKQEYWSGCHCLLHSSSIWENVNCLFVAVRKDPIGCMTPWPKFLLKIRTLEGYENEGTTLCTTFSGWSVGTRAFQMFLSTKLAMAGSGRWYAAPVGVFSRGTTGISGSLSCGARAFGLGRAQPQRRGTSP